MGMYVEHRLRGIPVCRVDVTPVHSPLGKIEEGVIVLSSWKVPVQIRKRREQEHIDEKDATDWVVERMGSSLPFYPDVKFTEEGREVGADEEVKYTFAEIASTSNGQRV